MSTGLEKIGRHRAGLSCRLCACASELLSAGFAEFAKRDLTSFGAPFCIEGNVGWTRYEWIRGEPVTGATPTHASIAGGVLARLHDSSSGGESASGSRLTEVAGALARLEPVLHNVCWASTLVRCVQQLTARLAEICSLPRAIIHGDFILDNMLVTEDGPRLVDFEFSRRDLRIFDLAPLIAPYAEIGRELCPCLT